MSGPSSSRAMVLVARWGGAAVALVAGLALALQIQPSLPLSRAAVAVHALWLAGAVVVALVRRRVPAVGGETEPLDWGAAAGLFVALCFYLLSAAARNPSSFFFRWVSTAAEPVQLSRLGLTRFALLTLVLTPVFLRRVPKAWLVLLAALLVSQAVCFTALMRHTGGGTALYNDDHPAFMYRFWTIARTLPQFVSYDPFWNGGRSSPFLVATGALPMGFLLWPLWRFLPVHDVYTPAVGFSFIILIPLLAAAAVRLAGGSRTAAFAAALASIGISRQLFTWLLHFGTVASSFCLFFMLPVAAALYRVLWMDRREWWTGAALVLSAYCLVMWPPGGLMTVPLMAAVLLSAAAWSRRKILFLVVCGIVLVAMYLPYFAAVAGSGDPAGFAEPPEKGLPLATALWSGWKKLGEVLHHAHPALVLFGLGGWPLVRRRGFRLFWGPVLLGLAALAGWGELVMPQIPFSRAGIPLMFAAMLPAGLVAAAIFEAGPRWLAPVRAGLLALLLLGAHNAVRYYRNPPTLSYSVLPDDVRELAGWIRENTPANGRILFAGQTVHAYGRGHVAYLPVLTGREMMASDYYHFSPSRVDYHYPPRPFRASEEGVQTFFDLYNVTHVITFHDNWKRFFREQPQLYEQVKEFPGRSPKSVFRVKRDPSYFAEGSGNVAAHFNQWRVRLDAPADRVVLKYNWADGLVATPPVELMPYEAAHGVRLIAARPNGAQEFTIRYRWSPWARRTDPVEGCASLAARGAPSQPGPARSPAPTERRPPTEGNTK